MKKTMVWRIGIYLAGLLVLSTGIAFSTKTGLGVSTVTAPPFAVHQLTGINLSVLIFVPYALMVVAQFIMKGKDREWIDLLQFPVSIAFSSFVGWFGDLMPIHFEHLWQNLLLMAAGIIMSGVGVATMVAMQIVPNPPDGVVYTISRKVKRDMGLVKNIFDACCVAIAVAVDLIFTRRLVSVGIGTVCAMLFIGRTVYLFNRFCRAPIRRLAGLEQTN